MAGPQPSLPHDVLYVQELIALTAQSAAGLAHDRPAPGSDQLRQQEGLVSEFRNVLKEGSDRLPPDHPLAREAAEVYRAAGDVLAHSAHPDAPGAGAELDKLASRLAEHAHEPELPSGPPIAREWGSASEHGAPTPLDVAPIAREWGSASDVPTATSDTAATSTDAAAIRGAITHLASVTAEHAGRILDFTRANSNVAEIGNQVAHIADPHEVVRLADTNPLEQLQQARAELTTYQQLARGAESELTRLVASLPANDPLRQQAEQAIDMSHQLDQTGFTLFNANLEFVGDQGRAAAIPGLEGVGTDSSAPNDEEVILDAREIVELEGQVARLGNQAHGLAESAGAPPPPPDDSGSTPGTAPKPTDGADDFRLPPTFPKAEDGGSGARTPDAVEDFRLPPTFPKAEADNSPAGDKQPSDDWGSAKVPDDPQGGAPVQIPDAADDAPG